MKWRRNVGRSAGGGVCDAASATAAQGTIAARIITPQSSRRHEGVSRVDFRRAFDANLLENRHQLLAEAAKRLLGLPHVDDAEAFLGLSGNMNEHARDRPVGRRLHSSPLPTGQPSNRLLIVFSCETWRLKDGNDRHIHLLTRAGSIRRTVPAVN